MHWIRPAFCRAFALAAWFASNCGWSLAAGMDLVDVVKKLEPAVVQIETDLGLGSGVILDDSGLVLTNFHVVEGAKQAKVKLRSGETVEARGFLLAEPTRDLALLKIDKLEKPRAASLAAEVPQTGEKVAAFGNPLGLSFTTSEGIVSAVRGGAEVSDIIGAEGYRELGYDVGVTWIQTTAQISHGNSGGPLVNMNAQVVGLNTWSVPDGQNLNFAVGLPDIKQLMEKSGSVKLKEFARLPKPRARRTGPKDRVKRLEDFTLEFPTGRMFSFRVFETERIPFGSPNDRDGNGLVLIRHPNGALCAATGQKEGLLEGLTIAMYENKEPMLIGTYQAGKRHGVIKTWDEKGRLVLMAQYTKGKRHGLSCFFDDGRLRLLAEHKFGDAKWLQLMADQKVLQGFPSREEADKNSEAREILLRLDKAEDLLKTNELAFRKKVQSQMQERRRALATQIGSQKRAQDEARTARQSAEDAASLNQLYRSAYGR